MNSIHKGQTCERFSKASTLRLLPEYLTDTARNNFLLGSCLPEKVYSARLVGPPQPQDFSKPSASEGTAKSKVYVNMQEWTVCYLRYQLNDVYNLCVMQAASGQAFTE